MKRVALLALMAFMGIMAGFSQSSKTELNELIKERKLVATYAKKQLDAKVLKDAKKQAKLMAKQGWVPAVGSLPLVKQLTELYVKQYEVVGSFPRYLFGRSTANGTSFGVARKHALARARVDVANTMSAEVAALTETTESNVELTGQEIETVAKMVETSKLLTQQTLGKTSVILDACRETKDGVESMVVVSYEGKLAIQAVLESFGEDEAQIKSKLESLLKQ